MTDIISNEIRPNQDLRNQRKDWSPVGAAGLGMLALTYLAAAAHARYAGSAHSPKSSGSIWFPLELFLIAIAPALVGFLFLWSERRLKSRATQRLARNLGIFGVGLILAAWVAAVIK